MQKTNQPLVDDTKIWIFVLWPLISILLSILAVFFFHGLLKYMSLINILAPLALFIDDRRQLNKAGFSDLLQWWWIFIAPVYIWKRSKLTGSKPSLFYCQLTIPTLYVGFVFMAISYYENSI